MQNELGLTEWIAAASTLGTFLAAIVALIIAKRQLSLSRELEAFSSYENYHRLMLEYPDLGTGGFEYDTATDDKRRQYEVFVMSMLLTMERVMVLRPKEPSWEVALEDDLLLHHRFLCSQQFVPLVGALNRDVAAFIKRTARKHAWDYKAGDVSRR